MTTPEQLLIYKIKTKFQELENKRDQISKIETILYNQLYQNMLQIEKSFNLLELQEEIIELKHELCQKCTIGKLVKIESDDIDKSMKWIKQHDSSPPQSPTQSPTQSPPQSPSSASSASASASKKKYAIVKHNSQRNYKRLKIIGHLNEDTVKIIEPDKEQPQYIYDVEESCFKMNNNIDVQFLIEYELCEI